MNFAEGELGRTHYEVLGVDRGASRQEVKEAYMAKARVMHPDRNGGTKESNDAFAEVTCAWSTLADSKRRLAYDNSLDLLTVACSACKGKGRIGKQKGFSKKEHSTCAACQGSGRVSRR